MPRLTRSVHRVREAVDLLEAVALQRLALIGASATPDGPLSSRSSCPARLALITASSLCSLWTETAVVSVAARTRSSFSRIDRAATTIDFSKLSEASSARHHSQPKANPIHFVPSFTIRPNGNRPRRFLTVVKSPSSLQAHKNWDCFIHSRQSEPRLTLLLFHEMIIRSASPWTTLRILTRIDRVAWVILHGDRRHKSLNGRGFITEFGGIVKPSASAPNE